MRKHYKEVFLTLATLLVSVSIMSCAETSDTVRQRPQITSCPEGLILICETGRPQQPSKSGPEEEIPQYDRCRCEVDPR
jgi:hypothetical protein